MVMFEQSRRLSEPLRWGRRERTAIAATLACLLIALLALGAYALTSGSPARSDCIRVTFASTLGGADLHGCGAQARRICASGQFASIEHELRAACLHARLPYKAPS
jgi:hypothetical protein